MNTTTPADKKRPSLKKNQDSSESSQTPEKISVKNTDSNAKAADSVASTESLSADRSTSDKRVSDQTSPDKEISEAPMAQLTSSSAPSSAPSSTPTPRTSSGSQESAPTRPPRKSTRPYTKRAPSGRSSTYGSNSSNGSSYSNSGGYSNNGNYSNGNGSNNSSSNGNSSKNNSSSTNSDYDQYSEYDSPRSSRRESRIVTGFLDNSREGHGVLRIDLSKQSDEDVYISTSMVRRFGIRPGDVVSGPVREPKDNERYWGLLEVTEINGADPNSDTLRRRPKFKDLTPVYPDEQIELEIGDEPMSLRIIDMIAPIGKGQRSLIVSPPKAGKTTLLKNIATAIASNNPEIHVMAVLVGERPEEVTDIKRHIARLTKNRGEVAASNFDENATDQVRAAEMALERAKRLVETGQDVVILLDSITRLARAYNLAMPTSGRTLSGGFDPQALFPPKRFFGAARNFEIPGSLTIIGTALIDTGSRMDDLIYEEFKGTGNQEIHLDRRLAERRIYPAIDVQRSGTRRDDLLMDGQRYQQILTVHRMLDMLDREERTSTLVEQLKKTKSNKEFLATLKQT